MSEKVTNKNNIYMYGLIKFYSLDELNKKLIN